MLATALLGCAAPASRPIGASGSKELAPDEGLLIVHIDTDIALDRLALSRRRIASSLGKGKHVWMVRLPEGGYRWHQLEFQGGQRRATRYRFDPDDAEFRFDVKAGKINYPGELVIRSGSLSRWGFGALVVRNRNHSAMAIRALQKSHDHLLRSHPVRYAGAGGDAFLEYYERERDRVEAQPGGGASSEARTQTRVAPP